MVAIQLDVSKPEQIEAAAKQCQDVSIVVNNAGQFTMQTLLTAPDLSGAREEMEVNYFGPLAMSRAFAPILARHAESAIVNVLSAGGIVAVPGMGGYSPSKFAARAMSTCLRAELAPQNTSVTALISFVELTRAGQLLNNMTFQPFEVFLTVAAMYFIVCYPLSWYSEYLKGGPRARRATR